MMDLSERIKNLREANNLTHSEVAATLKKSEGAVRSWEMKRSKPDADTLIKLAKIFNCTADYLLGLSDYKNIEEKEELDEFLNSIKSTLALLDKDILELMKESIRDYLAVWNLGNRSNISIEKAVTIAFTIQQIICSLKDTASALDGACGRIENSHNIVDDTYYVVDSDYYSVQYSILSAYDKKSRIQRLLLNTFALLIDKPANEIGRILNAQGYNTDFITSDYSDSLNRLLTKVSRNGRNNNAET